MTGWRSGLAALAASVACVTSAPASYADQGTVPGTRLFAFQDTDIIESSGLVDRGSIVFTNNDSGDAAVVYGVDPATGRTVSRTTYADSVGDVEAIAAGAGGTLWAGDIGDNNQRRNSVAVYRMRPRDGRQPSDRFTLTYPDGPHDAETLLVQPRTQRAYVVSKSVFGGTVYVAPRHLVAGTTLNRLRPFARVDGLVTDGSFFPDGRHVVLRTYGTASVYTFPAFELVGTVRLPSQQQGEGISVGRDGRVLVSSEGMRSEVLRVSLPGSLTAPSASAAARPAGPPPSTRAPSHVADPRRPRQSAEDWVGIGLVASVVAGLGYLTLRVQRRSTT